MVSPASGITTRSITITTTWALLWLPWTDEVEFDSPQSFGTALITFSPDRKVDGRNIWVGKGSHGVHVEVATDEADIQIRQDEIDEDVHSRHLPVRLGIDLTQPVTRARIVMTIQPATDE